jgi:hypothetical protein
MEGKRMEEKNGYTPSTTLYIALNTAFSPFLLLLLLLGGKVFVLLLLL